MKKILLPGILAGFSMLMFFGFSGTAKATPILCTDLNCLETGVKNQISVYGSDSILVSAHLSDNNMSVYLDNGVSSNLTGINLDTLPYQDYNLTSQDWQALGNYIDSLAPGALTSPYMYFDSHGNVGYDYNLSPSGGGGGGVGAGDGACYTCGSGHIIKPSTK